MATAKKNQYMPAPAPQIVAPPPLLRRLAGVPTKNESRWTDWLVLSRSGGLGACDGHRAILVAGGAVAANWSSPDEWGRTAAKGAIKPADLVTAIKGAKKTDLVSMTVCEDEVRIKITARDGSETRDTGIPVTTMRPDAYPGLNHVIPDEKRAKLVPVIGTNASYAADMFAFFAGMTVRISMFGELDPMMVRGELSSHSLYACGIVMPCRI